MDLVMERLTRLEREVFGMDYEEARNLHDQFNRTIASLSEIEAVHYYDANADILRIAGKVTKPVGTYK